MIGNINPLHPALNLTFLSEGGASSHHEEGRHPDQEQEAVRQVQEEEGRDGGLLQARPRREVGDGHGDGDGQWLLLRQPHEWVLPPDVPDVVPVHVSLHGLHGGQHGRDAVQPLPAALSLQSRLKLHQRL